MKAVAVRVGKKAEIIEINNRLENLQRFVGGYIECTYPWNDDVILICDEEGKINYKLPNRVLENDAGEFVDVIFGDFLIVGDSYTGDFVDLTDELAEKYKAMFDYPEEMVLIGSNLISVKVDGSCEQINAYKIFNRRHYKTILGINEEDID